MSLTLHPCDGRNYKRKVSLPKVYEMSVGTRQFVENFSKRNVSHLFLKCECSKDFFYEILPSPLRKGETKKGSFLLITKEE